MMVKTAKAFPIVELTVAIALALIGWAAFRLYEITPPSSESRNRLVELRDGFFKVSSHLESSLATLNALLTNAVEIQGPAERKAFETKGAEFIGWAHAEKKRWINTESPDLEGEASSMSSTDLESTNTPPAQLQLIALLGHVEQATTNYLRAAAYIITNRGRPLLKERLDERQQVIQRTSTRITNLARQARLHGESLQLALSGSEKRFTRFEERFRHLRWALLCAIVALCLLLILAIYRGKVAQAEALVREHRSQHLEQEAKLDKLSHFGRLAQELAHEIKQPLTAINARAYTLQKTLSPDSEEYKDAAVIRREIKRLDRTVKDFLELARPAEPRMEPLQGEEILGEIRDLMSSQMDQEAIELKFECEEGLQFLADPQQLKQVLINLLKNAAESVQRGDTITLRAKKQQREIHGDSTEAVVIEVEDTGVGIPPEIQGKIFDPFFSTKGDGTGLGLAIAARIIDSHGGKLDFESELGKGTTFRIVLPACPHVQPA